MSIIYKGIVVSNIIYNGVSLDKVIYNGVVVFEKVVSPVREPASGEYFCAVTPSPRYCWKYQEDGEGWVYLVVFWNEISVYEDYAFFDTIDSIMNVTVNGWTYYRGTKYGSGIGANAIYRIKN